MKSWPGWWGQQTRSRQATVGVGAFAVMLLLLVAAVTVSGVRRTAPVHVAIAPIPTTTASPSAVETATPSPTATGVPTITSLDELKKLIGDPPPGFAPRGRFLIPRIGVDAPIGVRVVPASLQMEAPVGPSDVVLYDFSADPVYGGMPGAGGNAIFAGHVDYSYKLPYADANYTGEGVFYSLSLLQQDDTIQVVIDGQTMTYSVQWMRTVSADTGDWAQLLAHDVGGDAITLVTCDGTFNPTTREYTSRTVVRAVRTA